MDDTDQMQRVTTPFVRPSLDGLEPVGQLDLTPTTAPGNTPGTPRRRLARGTLAPPASAVELLKLEATALPVRLIDPPARWSYRERVDLDAAHDLALTGTFLSLRPVAGEIDTAPVRRIGGTPWRLVGALSAVTVIAMIAAVWVASGADTASSKAAAPTITPATVVVALPAEPPPAPPAAETIVLPANPADDLAAIDAAAAAASATDIADEIEMPAHEVATTEVAKTAPAPAAATHATLMIGSKPPCRILIDGKDTGLTTPNRAVRVPAGRRTITLVNRELGIRHSETLNITGGRKAKMIRDLTSKI
jgi:hypothetical protein